MNSNKKSIKEVAKNVNASEAAIEHRLNKFTLKNGYQLNNIDSNNVCDMEFIEGSENSPEHILECSCSHHTGICVECKRTVTYQSEDAQYGHSRGRNSRPRCEHRPDNTDPKRSKQRG